MYAYMHVFVKIISNFLARNRRRRQRKHLEMRRQAGHVVLREKKIEFLFSKNNVRIKWQEGRQQM